MLGALGKSSSADGKMSRSSLTRGGSQEDPVQLLRDLQDSIERESDIREQLKFAEEEVSFSFKLEKISLMLECRIFLKFRRRVYERKPNESKTKMSL